MVEIYCSHCVVVFPSISALHEHIKEQVPDGSYTFDFKSQTGYPSETPFPFDASSETHQLKEKPKNSKQKANSKKRKYEETESVHETDNQSEETYIPILKIKEEVDFEGNVTDNEVSDLDVTDPVDSMKEDHDSTDFAEYCGDLLYRNYREILQNGSFQDSNEIADLNVVDDDDDNVDDDDDASNQGGSEATENTEKDYKNGDFMKKSFEFKSLFEGSQTDKKNVSQKETMPCFICGVLVKKCKMKEHVMNHGDSRPYECKICKRRFFTRDVLKQHQKDFHVERIFKCHLCPRAYRKEKVLKDHIRGHKGEKKYVCPTCGEAFRWYHSLQDHLVSHTGLLKFECTHCGKRFKRSTNLNTHIKNVHDRVKDWICSWPGCEKRFYGGPTLRRHMILHTGEKPVRCDHCEAGFIQRNELKIHLQKKHNIDTLPPPSNNNLFSGLPQVTIQNPFSKEGDTANLKTFFFPTVTNNPYEDLVIKYKDSSLQPHQSAPSFEHTESNSQLTDTEKTSRLLQEITMQHLQDLTEPIKRKLQQEDDESDASQKQSFMANEQEDDISDEDMTEENLYSLSSNTAGLTEEELYGNPEDGIAFFPDQMSP